MSTKIDVSNESIFNKLKSISNRYRFKILELTQNNQHSISELSSILNLSYTKCADYVSILEKQGLVEKNKDGKEVRVKSKIKISSNQIVF